ncbi:MAG: PIG-L family deacetylase [Thermoproteales archaeon]|nr:PIG-L family deacetylase [Thermoproteales archaeon]
MNKIIALFVAHPDDEIFSAGTLAKHARNGYKVFIIWMTNGEYGHYSIPPEKLKEIRHKECLESAKIIGAEPIFIGYRDAHLEYNMNSILEVVKVIRRIKPNIVITHALDEYHKDHRNTSMIVRDAVFIAGLPTLEVEGEPHVVDSLYFYGKGLKTDIYVDISDYLEYKIKAMEAHKSQVDWLRSTRLHGFDPIERIKTVTSYHGLLAGVKYAEVFTPSKSLSFDFLL